MDYVSTYIEVNLISIIMLVYLLVRFKHNYENASEAMLLNKLAYSLLLVALLNIIWVVGENTSLAFTHSANYLVNIVCMIAICINALCWFIYNEQKLCKWKSYSKKMRALFSIPLILSTLSPWTGWLFYIDDSNHFQNGKFRIIQVGCVMIYLIVAAAHSIICAGKENCRAQRSEDLSLASFFILPLLFSLTDFYNANLPASAIGSTLALMFVYNKIQDYRIFCDALTGLNNRRRADEYFDLKIANYCPNMVFILGDVNNFKTINDTYGHAAGDKALVYVANALKSVCGSYNAFLARYGGDEFCIIWKTEDDKTPERFIGTIQNNLARASENSDLPYEISMSFGYARTDGKLTGDEILDIADKMMYRNKAEAHERLGYNND